jgi:hypothetical protein
VIGEMLNKIVKEQMIKRDFRIKALNISELVDMWIRLGLANEVDIEEGYSPVEAILKMREEED